MKSDGVTKVWEFYRDNCPGFKEPMRKELHKLDDYVASVEAENAKLRELVRAMATRLAYADRVIDGGVFDARLRREVAEVGVEVDAQ